MATHGLANAYVVRMSGEAAAMRRWRNELALGGRVTCLGRESEEQVSLWSLFEFIATDCEFLENGIRGASQRQSLRRDRR